MDPADEGWTDETNRGPTRAGVISNRLGQRRRNAHWLRLVRRMKQSFRCFPLSFVLIRSLPFAFFVFLHLLLLFIFVFCVTNRPSGRLRKKEKKPKHLLHHHPPLRFLFLLSLSRRIRKWRIERGGGENRWCRGEHAAKVSWQRSARLMEESDPFLVVFLLFVRLPLQYSTPSDLTSSLRSIREPRKSASKPKLKTTHEAKERGNR